MDEIKYSFKPTGQLSVLDLKPNYNISFHNNGQEIGKLDFNGPALVFTGDAEESAKVFIDWIARSFHGRLEEERKAAQPAPVPLTEKELRKMYHEDQFGLFCDFDEFEQIVRATEQSHGITEKGQP